MIQQEKRNQIWHLIKRTSKKLGVVDIPEETYEDFFEYMKLPSESVRYLIIEYYNLDSGFYYHAFEESDVKDMTDAEKMKYMFEHYFNDGLDSTGETLLLVDVKNLKAYTLCKEVKYTKKEVK